VLDCQTYRYSQARPLLINHNLRLQAGSKLYGVEHQRKVIKVRQEKILN
jgi:hypothetical protein